MKLVITGQLGFIGFHLYNSIKFKRPDIEVLDFNKNCFSSASKIDSIFKKVDIIIHLAGINRSDDQDFLYNKNLLLSNKIVESIKRVKFKGKLIFASSSQEKLDNAYGRAKKESRELFFNQSIDNRFSFIGLIIPNVFGPFCKPNYNSFISTFSNNLILGVENEIIKDNSVPLIYIDNLISEIIDSIDEESNAKKIISEDIKVNVTEVKDILEDYHNIYYKKGEIPNLNSKFKINLFNTFNHFIQVGDYYPRKYNTISDSRGIFTEVIRSDTRGQYSYSITQPGEVRGNHFHTRKIERFAVISGHAEIKLRKVGDEKITKFIFDGSSPSYIDMPVWYTHNIINIGETPLITLFWINEFYDENDSDTFFEKV